MCIIVAKPAGVKLPNKKTRETCWYNNYHGAGIMYAKDGEVVIDKGYMNMIDFEARIGQLHNEIDVKNTAMVLHYRIGTHGGKNPECCHPFPVTDSIGALKKLNLTTNVGVAHNGVISITPRASISDTMEYIASQMSPLKRALPDFWKDKNIQQLILNATLSKFAFLSGDGSITTIGAFNECDGVQYSNFGYRPYMAYRSQYYYDPDITDVLPLMWLQGGYVITDKGEVDSAYSYLMDEDNNLYRYDYYSDCAFKREKYRHVTDNGVPEKFNVNLAESVSISDPKSYREPKTYYIKGDKFSKL